MPASLVEQHNKFFARQEVTQLKAVVAAAAPRFGAAARARGYEFVTIRNCLFGLIALVEAPRGTAAREFIVSNERKSFAGGKKSYWNFSNCCWMREKRESPSTAVVVLLANSSKNVAAAKIYFS